MARIENPDDPGHSRQRTNPFGGGDSGPAPVGAPGEPIPRSGPSSGIDLGSQVDNQINDSVPGASVDTSQADADRARMAQILAQLQTAATTGGGAWEQALANSTEQARGVSSALGMSGVNTGQDPMAAARGIYNGQTAASQQAVGEGNLLRAQTEQGAQADIASINAATNSTDAQQAAEQAAAAQARREANNEIAAGNYNNTVRTAGAVGQAVMAMVSKGGEIPGKPRVYGDDEANDTVPAWLSPGEIVIPRTIAQDPAAAEKAASFVAAVKKRGQSPVKLNGGGPITPRPSTQVGEDDPPTAPAPNAPTNYLPPGELAAQNRIGQPGDQANTVVVDSTGNEVLKGDSSNTTGGGAWNPLSGLVPGQTQQNASTLNGGLLKVEPYNATRDAVLGSADTAMANYGGAGPTLSTQQAQSSTDAALAQALQGRAGASGMGAQAATGAANMRGVQAAQRGAEGAAETRATEAEKSVRQAAQLTQQQRAQDLAFAQARQQAAWRNSMLNSGIGLAQQAQLRSLLGGVGQAASATSSMFGDKAGDYSEQDVKDATQGVENTAVQNALNTTPTTSYADTNTMLDDSESLGNYAHGGMVDPRAAAFVKALERRRSA